MVRRKHSEKQAARQATTPSAPDPHHITATTPFEFSAKNLTPYGGLLPVATMLEQLGFHALLEDQLTISRVPRVMSASQFVLAIVLGMYLGFARLSHLRFVARDPMLTGILHVPQVPPQSTLWRFLDSLHRQVARQIVAIQVIVRERVWAAAHVRLTTVTLDTDTTVHTVYGQKMGARKSYNPKNKGKKSYQPILTFLAETREYVYGELHNGDRPTGKQIAAHLTQAFHALPAAERRMARADSGFYCAEAVAAYEAADCRFVIVARKTQALLAALTLATWTRSRDSDADEVCEFRYQPAGWPRAYRFVALRYEQPSEADPPETPVEQYQLFATAAYTYRVFVTDMTEPIAKVVAFYNKRAGAENLIKEANNDAGLAAHPSKRFDVNSVHFQLAMLAYNLNCWLMLLQRDEKIEVDTLTHTTLATARLKFLFIAAKIWRHAGRTGISYSADYPEQPVFQRLMDRLRRVTPAFTPVIRHAMT
jgi:hypothetical protein